jgi:serine/threonine protein kinase/Tol biopolymer transport system component
MPIQAGTRLGSYEVIESIGTGGMGQVYRARDPTLNRDVAIKILLPDIAGDPERLARFKREAQTLASLNHPNVAQIHGFEQTGSTGALVMELVSGEDLSVRIARGALSLEAALAIAEQIAAALEAAHERSVVHRDLKPANIKVREDGTVKVLDFGLAKAITTPAVDTNVDSATISSAGISRLGSIVGTAAYMAPEQARGQAVDQRADIWAFGCVLFEMLAGVRAFRGTDTATIVSSVLTTEPDWSALPPGTPAAIRRLLRRCLQKNPSSRLRHIGDAAIEIDDARSGALADDVNAKGAVTGRRTSPLPLMLAAIAALALTASLWLLAARPDTADTPEMRFHVATPTTDHPTSLAISPDGRMIAFVASDEGRARLWIRSQNSTTPRALAGTDGASLPFWSPDSRAVGFFADDGRLKRVDVVGGGGVTDLARASLGRGGAWAQDHTIFFVPSTGGVYRIADTGGEVTAVTQLGAGHASHALPEFLPGGRHFIFSVMGGPDVRGAYVAAVDGSGSHRLVETDTGGVAVSGEYLLFVRGSTLHAQRLDLTRLQLQGDTHEIAQGIAIEPLPIHPVAAVSASTTGHIVYRTGAAFQERQFIWFERSGKEISRVGSPDRGAPHSPALSPDGRRLALHRNFDGNTDIWIVETDRGRLTRLTSDPANDIHPTWSPDGRRVVFGSNRTGEYRLYERSIAGLGEERRITEIQGSATDWSPDGRFLLLQHRRETQDADIWALEYGTTKPYPWLQTEYEERDAQFSPDAAWIAYSSNESGTPEVYVRPFKGKGPPSAVSVSGGTQPRWRADGKELFFIALDGRLMAAGIRLPLSDESADVSTPVTLFPTRIGGAVQSASRTQYFAAPDGSRFLMNTVLSGAATAPITIVLNWKPRRPD